MKMDYFMGTVHYEGAKQGRSTCSCCVYHATRYPERVLLRSSEEPDTFIVECGEGTKITITDALSGVATN